MNVYDYIINGGGCAGLSLAYELEIHNKLKNKTLVIIEKRNEYKRDKTWSFWKTAPHNFDDCIKKSWNNFSVSTRDKIKYLECNNFPYQSIDSGLFYKKIISRLKKNPNIKFIQDNSTITKLHYGKSFVFNSIYDLMPDNSGLWQHFSGVEIETKDNVFDDKIINLMDFDCDQRKNVHFFYVLPFKKNKALIETTWLSKIKDILKKDYNFQIKNYIENHLNIKDYKITYKEEGAIPLFYSPNKYNKHRIDIGTVGGMTRLSTGYTFLNIQEHSKYIRENIENIANVNIFKIARKYQFLDRIFLNVLEKYPNKMPHIFFKMFNGSSNTIIKFLSNKSNIIEDLSMILKMPKWIFIKALLK